MDSEERGAPDTGVTRRSVLARLGASAGLAGVVLGLTNHLHAAPAAAQSSIVGTWLVRGLGGNRPVALLWVFFPGGILLSLQSPAQPSTHPGDAPDALEWQSPGAGQWLDGPSDTVQVGFAAIDYDQAGNAFARDQVDGTLQYDHGSDSWRAALVLTEVDLDGNFIASAPRRIAGTRVGVVR